VRSPWQKIRPYNLYDGEGQAKIWGQALPFASVNKRNPVPSRRIREAIDEKRKNRVTTSFWRRSGAFSEEPPSGPGKSRRRRKPDCRLRKREDSQEEGDEEVKSGRVSDEP
jgi:hypothetical protein